MNESFMQSLMAEPFTRTDGIEIYISDVNSKEFPPSIDVLWSDKVEGSIGHWYSYDEVRKLGLGDFKIGLAQIGAAHYREPITELWLEGKKPLDDELL